MSQLSKTLRDAENGGLLFWCPGCDGVHAVRVGAGDGPRWGYNGNPDKPTFTPSILVSGTKLTNKGRADMDAWREAGYPKPLPEKFDSIPVVCHSFVNNGRIQFLSDCTHALAGQTVDLPDWAED